MAALIVLVAVACGGSPHPQSGGGSVRATPASTAPPLAAWRQLGATQAPPASVGKVSLGGAQVVNQTSGAISDADAAVWAQALLRTYAYLTWAVNAGQDQFLVRSGLSSSLPVVQPNLNDIAQARAAGDRVEYTTETFHRLVLRAVPRSVQSPIESRALEAWRPYAFYLDAAGPVETDWIDSQGRRTVHRQVAAGTPLYELIGGELRHDALMGDIWVMSFDIDCTAASSRQVLGALCSQ